MAGDRSRSDIPGSVTWSGDGIGQRVELCNMAPQCGVTSGEQSYCWGLMGHVLGRGTGQLKSVCRPWLNYKDAKILFHWSKSTILSIYSNELLRSSSLFFRYFLNELKIKGDSSNLVFQIYPFVTKISTLVTSSL